MYNGTTKCNDSSPCDNKQPSTENVWMRSVITDIQKAQLFYMLISGLNPITHMPYHEKEFPRLSSVSDNKYWQSTWIQTPSVFIINTLMGLSFTKQFNTVPFFAVQSLVDICPQGDAVWNTDDIVS